MQISSAQIYAYNNTMRLGPKLRIKGKKWVFYPPFAHKFTMVSLPKGKHPFYNIVLTDVVKEHYYPIGNYVD
jgi:hypothetical protein